MADLTRTVVEALVPQGARGLNLGRPTSRDWALGRELRLNVCMLCELFVQILAAGLGTLAVVWATVVLLGGFSASLEGTDFWVITAIVFIETARVVGINLSPEAEFFNQVPPAFIELARRRPVSQSTGKQILHYLKYFAIIIGFLAILVLAVPMIAGLGCISLSIYRLFALLSSTHHHNSNVFRALMLFYALVLLQGGLFIISLCVSKGRFNLAIFLSSDYGLEDKSGLIVKYMNHTLSTAIKNGVSSTINNNLVSFAADLIKSGYNEDRIEAVWAIHRLTSQEDHRTRTLSQIQSSPLVVSSLLDMVTSGSCTDHQTKICVAEIVAHIGSNLHLADISGATESISSMIDPFFTNISTPSTIVNIEHHTSIDVIVDQLQSASAANGAQNITNSHQGTLMFRGNTSGTTNGITSDQEGTLLSSSTTMGPTNGGESKPLIIHGMLILAKLAVNPDNCKQIYDSKGLFSKIISPVKNKLYDIPSDDGITMEITEKALEVVRTLVRGTDETNGKIRQDICTAMNDIRPIMDKEYMYNKLKVPATKILTELYMDRSIRAIDRPYDISEFIKVLMKIFFDAGNDIGLRKTAGKALATLAMDNHNCTMIMNFSTGRKNSVIQLLTTMIHEENNGSYRTSIAQLLTQFCANCDSNTERRGLETVKTILHEVLKLICNVEQAENTNQEGSPLQNLVQQETANINLKARHSRASNRNSPSDNLSVVAQLVGARRKSLAAFLGLALQIFHTLEITADDFDTALARIPLSMGEFVDKLNDIIEQCKGHSVDRLEGKCPSFDYLIIIKTVTNLCTWMIQTKPDYMTEFQNKNTSTKLQGALEDMRDLEVSMILTGSACDMANYQSLSTIVAAARQKMDPNILGRSG